ncbi:MAG TPA: STAS domain-containing protein [Usitatibacter sp.]|nr:STAS domain-containing protein [Usitatibacter sp.]
MAAPATGPSTTGGIRAVRPVSRIGSEEYHSAVLPCAQEAAVLYSANHSDAAISILKDEIKDAVGRNNKQAWLMLFDLYQIARNREEFDALSMLFTVKFEQSPPAWADGDDTAADPRRTQNRDRKDFFAMKPAPPDGDLSAEINKFVNFAEQHGTVRLDLAKITAISALDIERLIAALQRLRKKGLPMWFNNLEVFEGVLRAAFNDKATSAERPYWLLLFELYILQGKAQAFEDLGLEYAMAFEISPPNWEVYVNKVTEEWEKQTPAAKAAATAAAVGTTTGAYAARPGPEAGFALKGVLSAASANQVADLNGHAASRQEVVVDMAKVLRIDFGFSAAFFDAIKAIQLAGKRVILTNLTELNAALLEALGVNRYAILVRRKST